MKIRFGPIYLAFLIVGLGYESYIHHFTEAAVVNYLLVGFLYSSLAFIIFYIIVRIAIFGVNKIRHKEA
jgi:hypothetical protein